MLDKTFEAASEVFLQNLDDIFVTKKIDNGIFKTFFTSNF